MSVFISLLSTIRNYSLSKIASDCGIAPSGVIGFANGETKRLSPPRINKLYTQLGLTPDGQALLPQQVHLWTVQIRDTALTALETLLTTHPVTHPTNDYWTITPFYYATSPQIPAEFWLFEQTASEIRLFIRFVPDSRENPRKKQNKKVTPRIKTDANALGPRVQWAPHTLISQTKLVGLPLSSEDYHQLVAAFENPSENPQTITWDWITQRLKTPPTELTTWATQAHVFSTPLHLLLKQIGLTETTHLNLLRLTRDPNNPNRLVFSHQAELEQKLHHNESFLYHFISTLLKAPNRQADPHALLSFYIETAHPQTVNPFDAPVLTPTHNPFANLHPKTRNALITTLLNLPYKTLDERETFLTTITHEMNTQGNSDDD